jgi:hypothetical protein
MNRRTTKASRHRKRKPLSEMAVLRKRWHNMISRCTNPQNPGYANYGGRGIAVCEEWLDGFDAFRIWAVSSGYSQVLSLDRIDVNGNYEPANCRWTTIMVQANNRRGGFKSKSIIRPPKPVPIQPQPVPDVVDELSRFDATRAILLKQRPKTNKPIKLNPLTIIGSLTLLGETFRLRDGKRTWTAGVFGCQCGRVVVLKASSVGKDWFTCGKGHKGSKPTSISKSFKRLYQVWMSMKQRCLNPKSQEYPRYGERGIQVCREWSESFESFLRWAATAGYRDGLSIDRIDVDRDYSPSNCRWATPLEQSLNKRLAVPGVINASKRLRLVTINGTTKPISHWTDSDACAVDVHTVYKRIKKGWSEADASTTSHEEEKRCRIALQDHAHAAV